MDLLGNIFNFTHQIKVIHSIPGRMRLSIPSAKALPDECKNYEDIFSKILLEVLDLSSFDYNYITGKALVTYDINKTDDKEILDKIKLAMKIITRHRKHFNDISPSEVEKTMKNIAEIIKAEFKTLYYK